MVNALLQELDQEAQTTFRVFERVTEAKLGWRPHEKSMTLGQLAMHVATLPDAIAELSTLGSFDVNTEIPCPGARSVAELSVALERSLTKARILLGAMDDAALASPWRIIDGDRYVAARRAFSVDYAESSVPPPRPVDRVSAVDRRFGSRHLRGQRG